MKTFISFSGGVESSTLCLLYGKGATAIFADTGSEHDEMYDRLAFCESAFKDIHEGDFELIRIVPHKTCKADKFCIFAGISWKMRSFSGKS